MVNDLLKKTFIFLIFPNFFFLQLEMSKNIQNDNKNNENSKKCWNNETFSIIDECSKCSAFFKNSIHACKATGYRETIQCEKYGIVSRR